MEVKTYGIPDLSEWYGKVKAGTLEVDVAFTGGTVSPTGAQPAYMVTKDPIKQFIIENSKEFKSGFIILLNRQEVPGTHPGIAMPKGGHTEPVAKREENVAKEDGAATNSNKQVVEVYNKADAIEWLKEHYPDAGYTANKLRSKEAFESACEEHAIEFVYTE